MALCIAAVPALMVSALPLSAASAPTRIVSLNLCTDQLLLALAPERIVALSVLATDPLLSIVADEARKFRRVSADAEDVLGHRPDLVVATPFAATTTLDMLRRLGRRVLIVEPALDADGLRRALRQLGAEIDARDKAEQTIAAFDRALARVASRTTTLTASSSTAPGALIINFGGLPSGPGSLADATLALAGFRNASTDYPADGKGAIPLEAIVAHPPDLLVLGQDPGDYHTVRADNLRHPALRALMAEVPTVALPQRLTLCATPHMTDAVEILGRARDAALRRHVRGTTR